MDFAKFQRLVEERTGFRTMEDPTAVGEYLSDSCGDLYTFYLRIGPGAVIEDVSYFTTGCGFGTATASLVVELVRGRTVDEAAALTTDEIEACLGGYPEKKKDYPQRVLEALRTALDDYRAKVASGAIPDYAAMPRPAESVSPVRRPSETAAAEVSANGERPFIRLH